jgi:transposase-like protein
VVTELKPIATLAGIV